MKFEFLKHTGDLKFKAYGKNLSELVENCTLAISSVLSKGKKIKTSKTKEMAIEYNKDYELMLYSYIEELICLFDSEGFVVSKAKVTADDVGLSATLYGDDAKKYKDLDSIKSPTYSEMYVRKNDKSWECQVVLDV